MSMNKSAIRPLRGMSEAELGAYLDVTGGCSGACYGWRMVDDPNKGGCGKPTCEGPTLGQPLHQPACPGEVSPA